jgi:hypothetical protein
VVVGLLKSSRALVRTVEYIVIDLFPFNIGMVTGMKHSGSLVALLEVTTVMDSGAGQAWQGMLKKSSLAIICYVA